MKTFYAICLTVPILGVLMSFFPRAWWTVLTETKVDSPWMNTWVMLLFFVLVLVASVLGEWTRRGIVAAWEWSEKVHDVWSHHNRAGHAH